MTTVERVAKQHAPLEATRLLNWAIIGTELRCFIEFDGMNSRPSCSIRLPKRAAKGKPWQFSYIVVGQVDGIEVRARLPRGDQRNNSRL